MQDLLKPVTKPLQRDNEAITSHHVPTKILGTNVEYIDVASKKKQAIERTRFFAKNGIKGVRLHKLTNPSWEGLGTKNSASDYDKEKLSCFDSWRTYWVKKALATDFQRYEIL